ncbi:MAG TPA: hypothetical protein DCZ20_00110 [Lachnospiraceae bacterium]|nr:hypothetical protein [Lachnospiraceae bacterium]
MKEKLRRFMYGRYGMDQFSRFLITISLIGFILSLLTGREIFYLIGVLALIYTYFRVFSKNRNKRIAENQKYWQMTNRFRTSWERFKRDSAQRKTHHIYKCPTCSQKIRVPRGKGRIEITCPKCGTKFIKNS